MIEYIFKKPYVCKLGTLSQGSSIRFFRGAVYFDGGMVDAGYGRILSDIVNNKQLANEYLVKREVVNNEI